MRPSTPMERGAQEVRSLLSEGYLYVGRYVRRYNDLVTSSWYLRHANGNRARVEVGKDARLYINRKLKKKL